MSQRNPDSRYDALEQVLPFCFRQEMKNIHTAMPGVIVEYNPETKRASVQMALNLLISRTTDHSVLESISRAPLIDVPVLQPSGGGYVVHFPMQPGDPVMLVFSERGMQNFKQSYQVSDPIPEVLFDAQDAVAFPGFGGMEIKPAGEGLCMQTEDGSNFVEINNGQISVVATESIRLAAPTVTISGASDTVVVP